MRALSRPALLLTLLGAASCGRLRFEDLRRDAQAELDADRDAQTDLPGEAGTLPDAAAAQADAANGPLDAADSGDAAGGDATNGDAGKADASTACAPGFSGLNCATCVRFVDVASTSKTPDGLSWKTAFPDVIAGTASAESASQQNPDPRAPYCQVWVHQGRYLLYVDNAVNTIPLSPVAPMFGSFAGTEQDPSERDIAAHPSILDGSDGTSVNHVWHPVYATSGGSLDGFTITNGRANGTSPGPHADGGGLHVSGGRLTVRNVTFIGNTTAGNGGGLYAQNAVVTVDHCTFVSNWSDTSGGAIAMLPTGTGGSGSLTLTASELRSNVAGGNGGGLFATGDVNLQLTNLVIAQNVAGGAGGGAAVTGSKASLLASTLAANTSGSSASGLYFNCPANGCTVTNSILWDVSALPELFSAGTTVRQSIVRGGSAGSGITASDPLFVAAPTDLHLSASSPAIDAADGCAGPELDYDGQRRRDLPAVPNSGVAPVFADCGAYEVQQGGSPYPAFSTVCP